MIVFQRYLFEQGSIPELGSSYNEVKKNREKENHDIQVTESVNMILEC